MSTSSRPPGGWRRSLLPLVVVAATLVACETRRPEPLAPVASYTLADGRAEAAKAPTNTDSARTALAGEVRRAASAADTAAGGAVSDPLVMVYDARGALMRSFRMPARGSTGMLLSDGEFSPDRIASVEVVKNGALLPAEARGGVIRITLKEGAAAAPAESSPAPAPSPTGASGSERLRAAVAPDAPAARAPAASPSSAAAAADSAVRATPRAPAAAPTIVVLDDAGRELLRRQDAGGLQIRDLPVATDDIARVEIVKAGSVAQSMYIYLKPGATLRAR